MFSLPFLVAQLYPKKTMEEQQALVDACLSSDTDQYFARTWQPVERDDLKSQQIQLNLVRTLFAMQTGFDGVVEEIMRSIEDWTDGTIHFQDFDEDTDYFYQLYYCIIGFLTFRWLFRKRQYFLLASRFLPLAASMNIPVYSNVQDFFATLAFTRRMKEEALTFAELLRLNNNPIGNKGKTQHSIAEWIDIFDQFEGGTIQTRADDFIDNAMEVSRLSEEDKKILRVIITIYYACRIGAIWQDVDYFLGTGYERLEEPIDKTREEYYLEILEQFDSEQIGFWLQDYERIAEWLEINDRTPDYLRRLFTVIRKKMDMENEDQVSLLMSFIQDLEKRNLEGVDEIVYFDEETGEVKWEDDFFVPEDITNTQETEPAAPAQAATE